MKCLDPVLCYTDNNGKRKFRHFSHANQVFKQMHQTVFNCGKCLFCRKKRAMELAVRCVLHASMYEQNCFLTLTYDETKENYHNKFHYADVQKFKKKLRSYCQREFKKRIEIFNVHEYGKNGKKHYHLIVFGHDFLDKKVFTKKNQIPIYESKTLEEMWGHGFCTVGDVSEASAMYQSQYVQKDFKNGNVTNDKKSHSKHSGIGKPFFLKNFNQILTLGFIPFGGRKVPIPRYFLKLAERHYCHFYDQGKFFDLPDRKAVYRPFKDESEPNLEIANLFIKFKNERDTFIQQLTEEWEDVIAHHITTKEVPEFVRAAENALYDLKQRNKQEIF